MKKVLPVILIVLISFSAKSQSGKLDDILNKFQTYYRYFPSENVHLTTNKEVFRPGETIWFNALIDCNCVPPKKNISDALITRLYDSDGNLLMLDQFRIENGQSSGDIPLPHGVINGMYFLVAHTPLAKNQNDAFFKIIYIDSKDEDELVVNPVHVPILLKAGQENTISYSLHKISGKPYKSRVVKYELHDENKIISAGKLKTKKNGTLKINLKIPEKKFEKPLKLSIFDNDKHLNFNKTFAVNSEKLHLEFAAEGGNYIAGKPINIAYKVTNGLGQCVNIQGNIFDENGKKITSIKTLLPGFGMFQIIGEESTNYILIITSDIGDGQIFGLPEFKNEGLSIALKKTDDRFVHLRMIDTNNKPRAAYLIVSNGGTISWTKNINIDKEVDVKLPKEDLLAGLSIVSVIDTEGNILAERTIYVDKNHKLNVQLQTSSEKIAAGESFKLSINAKGKDSPVFSGLASISISALAETIREINELEPCFSAKNKLEHIAPSIGLYEEKNNDEILNNLLISSDLRGSIWNKILKFDTEKIGEFENGIGGYVYNAKNQPVQNAKISLVNVRNTQIITKTTDTNGYFFISGLTPEDKEDFVVKVIGTDGNKNLTVEFEKSFEARLSEHVSKTALMYSWVTKPTINKKFFEENRSLFKTIRKSKRAKKEPIYKAYLDEATNLMEVIRIIKPYSLQGDKIIFQDSHASIIDQGGALIVVDGHELGTNSSALNDISPTCIESINISTNVIDIQRHSGHNSIGVIDIKTKKGKKTDYEKLATTSTYKHGFRIGNDFQNRSTDSQTNTTLYWNPAMQLDSSGSLDIEVQTNTISGKFLIEVEVIDDEGRIGIAKKVIEVIK